MINGGRASGLFFALMLSLCFVGTATPASTGSINLTDKTWVCDGPVSLDSVTVTIQNASKDAVHLSSGCTGTIGSLTIVQWHRDGVKVGEGAHDLTIGGGSLRCYGKDPVVHQDGVQIMGGQRITFTGFDDRCYTSNNSAFFISQGTASGERPTDVVCDGCHFENANTRQTVFDSSGLRSGVRNSVICGRFRINLEASETVNVNNTGVC